MSGLLIRNFTGATSAYYNGGIPYSADGAVLVSADGLTVSVKDFDAVGDGVTDDTAAFQAALDSDYRNIYIPSGTYEITGKLTHSGKPVSIFGAGANNTILRWSSTGNETTNPKGIAFTQTSDSDGIIVRDVSFLTASSGTSGTAIKITGGSVNSGWIRAIISGVCIRGTQAVNLAGWNGGIDLVDMSQVVVRDCSFMGRYAGAFTNKYSEFFVRAKNSASASAHLQVSSNMVLHTNHAIDCDSVEGVYAHHNNFVVVNYGIYVNNSEGMKPQVQFTDNHVNAHITCVYLKDASQSEISQNNLYMRTDAGASIGVYGDNLYMSAMLGNKFVTVDSAYSTTGVQLTNTASTNNIIDNNVFQSATTAISLDSGTNLNVVGVGNSYGVVTTLVNDTGTNNYKFNFRHNRLEYQGVQVLGARNTGWGATMTGTADKTTVRDVTTVTTSQLAARFKALEDALRTHGLIGT